MATLMYPGQTTDVNMGFCKLETRLGDDVVTSGFAEELEHYQGKADPTDQQKCAELLSSLRFGQEQQRFKAAVRRPKTAMAELGIPNISHVTRPYETTYQREYVPRSDPNVRAIRPMTSQGFTEPESVPQAVHMTHYDDEFRHKHQRPASPYRTGTASGNRANKPHPPKSFMVWKFPSKTHSFPQSSPWSEELTNEKLNQVTKRLCRSTYQTDYLGIPQGFQVKSAFGHLPPDWKEHVPYTLNSLQRSSYRSPVQQPEHVVPTNRYGSNTKKQLASSGVIPTANLRAMSIKSRTTYDRHFNDLAPEVANQARDISRLLIADAIRLQHEKPLAGEKAGDAAAPYGIGADNYDSREMLEREVLPTPQPPLHPRPSLGMRSAHTHAQQCYRARPCVPEATHVTGYGYGSAYDLFQQKLDHPTPSPSHISVPYTPPLFLA